jgi:hypothetical protein
MNVKRHKKTGALILVALSFITIACSGEDEQEATFCEDGLGTINCVTARSDGRGNFQVVVKWDYDEPRDLGNGTFAGSSEWGANVLCDLSDGAVTYVKMNDEQGDVLALDSATREQVRAGLADNALPRVIDQLCS